jgi:DNA-binding transcriptional LysR family regulator
MNWDDMRFLLVLARRRTLSAAARELGVTQPTVGRRLTALERQLGVKLFSKSTSGFNFTVSGKQALEHAERMELDVLATERLLAGRDAGVRGRVRVTASEWLVSSVLAPSLGPLLTRHPQLNIHLSADPNHLNLARREADIALRPRRFEQAAIVERTIAQLGFGLYASRDYIAERGTPREHDGTNHNLIAMADEIGDVARGWLESVLPNATVVLRVNGRDAMRAAALAGIGLACLARIVGDAEPRLHRMALAAAPPAPTLWMGVHKDARSIARVRAVTAFLAERFRELGPRLKPPV